MTYSFPAGLPGGLEQFGSFNDVLKSYARDAIAIWGAVCGITFVETTAHVGDVTFAHYDWPLSGRGRIWGDSSPPLPVGVFDAEGRPHVYPGYDRDLSVVEAVDGVLAQARVLIASIGVLSVEQHYAALHELGHVLGLKHPWEGDITLSPVLMDGANTVMSNAAPRDVVLGNLDGRAARLLYGPTTRPGDAVPWNWDAATETLTQSSATDRALVRGTNARDIVTVTGTDSAVATMRGDDIVHAAGQSVEINTGSGFDIVHTGLRYGALTTPRDWGTAAVLVEAGAVRQFIVGAEQVVFENGVYDTATRRFTGDSGIAAPTVLGWYNVAGSGIPKLVMTTPPDMHLEFAAAGVSGPHGTDPVGENRVAWSPWWSTERTTPLSAKAVSIYGVQSESTFVVVTRGGLVGSEDNFTDASADPRALVVRSMGNDTVIGSPGDDVMLLGGGSDTVIYPGARAEYRIGINGAFTIVEGPQGRDVLRDVSHLTFADAGTVTIASLRATADGLIYYTQTDSYRLDGVEVQGATLTDHALAAPYAGPVAWLERQFLTGAGTQAVVGTSRAEFLNLGAGDDAANGGAGADVLDGDTGSSFLTGGAGRDIFFADGREGRTSWSTIADWEAGEELALWGWLPGISNALWLASGGVPGWTGATMHADLDANGSFDASITWSGQTRAALPTPVELDGLLWFR